MSKKMVKRSLALGALMAFVITGSAMAADSLGNYELKNGEEKVFNNYLDSYLYANHSGGPTETSITGTGKETVRFVGTGLPYSQIAMGAYYQDGNGDILPHATISNIKDIVVGGKWVFETSSTGNVFHALGKNTKVDINVKGSITTDESFERSYFFHSSSGGEINVYANDINIGDGDILVQPGNGCSSKVNIVVVDDFVTKGNIYAMIMSENSNTVSTIDIAAKNIVVDNRSGIMAYSDTKNAIGDVKIALNASETLKIAASNQYAIVAYDYKTGASSKKEVKLSAKNIEISDKSGYGVIFASDRSKVIVGGNNGFETAIINGNILVDGDAEVDLYLGNGGSLTGAVYFYSDEANVNLDLGTDSIWNLTDESTVSNVTFASGSVLNLGDGNYKALIDNSTGEAIKGEGAGTYAITAAGTETGLTVDGGAKLQITDIEETTYNIAAGFAGYENVAEKIDIADNALLQAEKIVSDGTNGAKYYQVEVKAKEADQMAADTGISESTAGLVETIIQNANSDAAKVDGSPEQAAVEFIQNVMNENGSDNAAVGNAINAATKMGEAGGNSATAASIVKNVTGVTNDRLSFNCGHSAPHKGGHGVGLFEEGSGGDIWVEYVHGKDEVEDMPSTAGKTSYEGQYNGIVMGVDFKKVNKFQSGIAFNYGEGDTNSLGSSVRTHSDYDFWGVGYYGNIHNDDSNVIFDINYAKTDSDVTQYNSGSTLEASPETTTWSAGVKLEKLYQNENVQIVPYTGLRYMSIDADDYSTKKGEFYYSMDRQDIWLLPVGVSIRQEVANDNGWTVSPRVDLSYIWAFGDTNSNMEVKSPFPGVSQIGYDVMDDGSFLGLVGIEAHKGQWGYGVAYSYQKGDHSESKKWYVDVNYSF